VFPDLSSRSLTVPLSSINGTLGLGLDAPTAAQLLRRMQLGVEVAPDSSALLLKVRHGPWRRVALNACAGVLCAAGCTCITVHGQQAGQKVTK